MPKYKKIFLMALSSSARSQSSSIAASVTSDHVAIGTDFICLYVALVLVHRTISTDPKLLFDQWPRNEQMRL